MKVNIDKTKVTIIGKKETNIIITLDQEEVEKVDIEIINNRIKSTTKLFYVINNTIIRKKKICRK